MHSEPAGSQSALAPAAPGGPEFVAVSSGAEALRGRSGGGRRASRTTRGCCRRMAFLRPRECVRWRYSATRRSGGKYRACEMAPFWGTPEDPSTGSRRLSRYFQRNQSRARSRAAFVSTVASCFRGGRLCRDGGAPRRRDDGPGLAPAAYRADRIAAPVAPLTTVNEGGERASNVASIPPIVPPSEPNGTNLSPLDPITDRPPAQPLADRDKLTPVLRAPQQNQSAAAPSQLHQLGSPRVRQPHRQVQPAGRPQKSELVPR